MGFVAVRTDEILFEYLRRMDGSAELPPQLRTALRAAARGRGPQPQVARAAVRKTAANHTAAIVASNRTRGVTACEHSRGARRGARGGGGAARARARPGRRTSARARLNFGDDARTLKAQLVRCQAGLRASAERAQVAEDAREPLERRVAELSAQLLVEQQRVADMLVEMAAPKTPPTSAAKGLEWTGPTPKQARDELRAGRERVVRAEERASQLQAAAAAREGKLREALEAGRRKAHHQSLALERAETKAAEAAERIAVLEAEKAAAEQAAHMRADAHSRAMADERARRRTVEAGGRVVGRGERNRAPAARRVARADGGGARGGGRRADGIGRRARGADGARGRARGGARAAGGAGRRACRAARALRQARGRADAAEARRAAAAVRPTAW